MTRLVFLYLLASQGLRTLTFYVLHSTKDNLAGKTFSLAALTSLRFIKFLFALLLLFLWLYLIRFMHCIKPTIKMFFMLVAQGKNDLIIPLLNIISGICIFSV